MVVLSDWTDERPDRVMGLLKSGNEWYAIERGTNQHVWGALRRGRLLDFLRRDFEEMRPTPGALARQKEWAREDPDLESLRGDPRFEDLVRDEGD